MKIGQTVSKCMNTVYTVERHRAVGRHNVTSKEVTPTFGDLYLSPCLDVLDIMYVLVLVDIEVTSKPISV